MSATTRPSPTESRAPEDVPTVMAVMVVRDAEEWLREALHALADQSYPRLGVLAVDDGSTDGSGRMLVAALGEERVLRNEEPIGLSGSLDLALAHPAARGADFLLLLHADVVLDGSAVTRLVEATSLQGVDRVGVVGGKVVDWHDPRLLRDVGRSADRFGHPYSPLQPDEIDQGQFDRVLEVLAVDPCVLLIAKDAWDSVGLFDDRLGEDGVLDLCWRVRVAGWRVLMTPLARVRHAAAEADAQPQDRRYREDRAAMAAALKNYSLLTLLWVVPLGLGLSAFRALFLLLSRRFEEAFELGRAVGWNVVHLPGTLARRHRVQKRRRTKDRQIRRFTDAAGFRLPRWFQTAEEILEEQREIEHEEEGLPASRRLRHRTASLFATHPVLVAGFFGVIVAILAVRHLIGPSNLAGGVLPAFPAQASGFFDELTSGVRTTPLGGSVLASPALGGMGALSTLLLGSTALAQKAMLAGGLVLAAILSYRAQARLTGRPGPSVLGAGAYVLSAPVLWAFSEGRIGLLAGLVVAPPLLERLEAAFSSEALPDDRWRFIAGAAVTLAIGVAFEPGISIVVGLAIVIQLLTSRRRLLGAARSVAMVAGGAILLFPFVPALLAGGGAAFTSRIGALDPWASLRLAFGGAPGSWVPALFLPIAAVLGLAISGGERRGPALRYALIAASATACAWLSVAGYLPEPLTNAPAYGAAAAAAEAMLVALGAASFVGVARESFGFRQIGGTALAVVLAVGLFLQAVAVGAGRWGIGGPDHVPPSWAVVDSSAEGDFNVLWVGSDGGHPFPTPGGDPRGIAEAGPATLTYGLGGRSGALAIDIGRGLAGVGAEALRSSLVEILGGSTVHGGALLAPFGIRYVVARQDGLPAASRSRLEEQSDIDLVLDSDLVIWRNTAANPPAAVLEVTDAERGIIADGSADQIARWRSVPAYPLAGSGGEYQGSTGDGSIAVIATEHDEQWRLEGSAQRPGVAFGWATSFDVAPSSYVRVAYGAHLPRTIAVWLLAALWAAAMWITRKPVRR